MKGEWKVWCSWGTTDSSCKSVFTLIMPKLVICVVYFSVKTSFLGSFLFGRFVLSLGWCKSCLVLNDQLQVTSELPALNRPVSAAESCPLRGGEASQTKLGELTASLEDADKPLPQLVSCCKTFDQVSLGVQDIKTRKAASVLYVSIYVFTTE